MSDQWDHYVKDPRTICKFGSKCYQKNREHHETYKHPPKVIKNKNVNNLRFEPYRKKDKEIKQVSENRPLVSIESEQSNQVAVDQPHPFGDENQNQMLTYDENSGKKTFKELFLLEMPSDFYEFYNCIKSLDKPIEETLASVSLQLIGPFDLLMGKLPLLNNKEKYLIHWRYFYDPPEYQAVLKGRGEYHIGYFRDDPEKEPSFLASNDSSVGCQLKPLSDNIFGAVYSYLQVEKKYSPFASMACKQLIEKIQHWSKEFNYSLQEFNIKARLSKTVTKTFHGAGIVVPYDKKTKLGYRPLSESDARLKKMFANLAKASDTEKDCIMTEVQSVITNATLAMDECDFGTGLEIGINLFCSGLKELEKMALNNLTTAYTLLNREAFSKIIQAHLKYRRKGPEMSIQSLLKT